MPDDKFRKCGMDIVEINRGVRRGGGKMRPYERAIWICKLSCGHTVERLKSQFFGEEPPKKVKCLECLEALDEKD